MAKLQQVTSMDVILALNEVGWAFHDVCITTDKCWRVWKVDKYDKVRKTWEEVKEYFTEKFGPRVEFCSVGPEYAPELKSHAIMTARAKKMRELNNL